MPIHVEVVSQERKLYEEPAADAVLVPGSEGQLGILPNHSPLITTMSYGELIVRKGGDEEVFAIFGGVVEVRPDKVVVLADAANFASDLNLQQMEEARQRAMETLASAPTTEEREELLHQLRRAELALNLSRKIQAKRGLSMRVIRDEE